MFGTLMTERNDLYKGLGMCYFLRGLSFLLFVSIYFSTLISLSLFPLVIY